MRIIGVLATGSLLFQMGGCSFGPFFKQAQVGFAEAFGAYAAGLLFEQLESVEGPGPICIGPGCGAGGTDPG